MTGCMQAMRLMAAQPTQHTGGRCPGPSRCGPVRTSSGPGAGPCPVHTGPRTAVVASSLRLTPLLTTRKRNQDSRAGKQVGKRRTCPDCEEKYQVTAGGRENLFTPSNTLESGAITKAWGSRELVCRALKTTALTQVRLCAFKIYILENKIFHYVSNLNF